MKSLYCTLIKTLTYHRITSHSILCRFSTIYNIIVPKRLVSLRLIETDYFVQNNNNILNSLSLSALEFFLYRMSISEKTV